jgi:hypothetical protein
VSSVGVRYVIVVTICTAIAFASVQHIYGHAWTRLSREHAQYAGYTAQERRDALITQAGLPAAEFEFFAKYIGPGDRVYYQVLPSGFSSFVDLPTLVEEIGRYYFMPAVQVTDLQQATVVVSWQEDPGTLHVHFLTQARAGLQEFFVSRIRSP